MATQIFVNIGTGYGLVLDGTKPLPEPMSTYLECDSVAFARKQFPSEYPVCLHNEFEDYKYF